MSDLIDRKAILKHIEKIRQDALMMDDIRKASIIMMGMNLGEKAVRNQPSVQPERKRGKWEMLQMPMSPPVYKCSVCGSHALQSMTGCLMNRHYEANLTNYCPNCGARMEK